MLGNIDPNFLLELLSRQELGSVILSPLKYVIREAIRGGVAIDTIVLLLLLPLVAAFIAAARHLIGLRGFGIFLPAALSIVFVSTGPVIGLLLFVAIVFVSTSFRMVLRKTQIKLQYLPRMALILWIVVLMVLGILYLGRFVSIIPDITGVSVFPVLILVLLAEDFTRVQLGKSARIAISLTSETLILALISFAILQLKNLQEFAILHPEMFLIMVVLFNLYLGKYAGLRLLELWRFRKLIRS